MTNGKMKTAWAGLGSPLEIGIFVLTAYQMAWAGVEYSTKTATEVDLVAMACASVLALMLGNSLIANWSSFRAILKPIVVVTVISIMGVSIVTSQLHFSSMFQGGFSEGITSDPAYIRAQGKLDRAEAELDGALESAAIADRQGNTSDAGYIRRHQVAAAKESIAKAEAAVATALNPNGAGDSKTMAMHKTAQMLNMSGPDFINALWLIVAAILEIGRFMMTLRSSASKRIEKPTGNLQAAEL